MLLFLSKLVLVESYMMKYTYFITYAGENVLSLFPKSVTHGTNHNSSSFV